MNRQPRITIITVAYNEASRIRETLESIYSQRYPNLEHIIIDGASSDDTPDIIREYQGKYHCFISEKDEGIYDAMNKGIGLATGEFIIFINAGDSLHSGETLRSVAPELEDNDFIYGNINIIYPPSSNKSPKIERYSGKTAKQYRSNPKTICHQAIFYRRNLFSKHGLYKSGEYKICADHEFNCRVLLDRNTRSRHVDVVIANFHQDGVSATALTERDLENSRIQKELFHNVWQFRLRQILRARKIRNNKNRLSRSRAKSSASDNQQN